MSEKRFMITGIEKGCYRIGNVKDIRKDTGSLGSVKLSELTGKSCILDMLNQLNNENEQLKQELQGMDELLQSYRKTIKHDAELLADASKNGYLPPLNDYVNKDGWICGCCKHFHSGVRDRCDKNNNWVLTEGSCQDFEREIGWRRK